MASNFWAGRRVFVTGATGMVGAWLVKALLAEHAYVVALVRDADPQSELFRSNDVRRTAVISGRLEEFGDLERAVNEHEIDTVFHLAAQPIVGMANRFPLPTFEANIRGTYNLLEACRVHSHFVKRVVVASSDKAYGEQALPYTEETPLGGRHPYEVSKSCTDLLTQSYHHTYKLPVTIARCGNIYGGGDLNYSRIVPSTIRSFLEETRPVIRSDGTFVRDYIYVKDVVGAYMRLAERLDDERVQGQGFNFSPERPLTVLELVEIIQKIMHCEHLIPDIRRTAHGEIRSQYLSSRKAQEVLDWRPAYMIETGLTETIAWYKEF